LSIQRKILRARPPILACMANNVQFFSIHCEDVQRARHFYEQVFSWRCEPWGPPGFYLIHTGDDKNPGILGALQGRHEPLTGTGMKGFECTISVEDIDKAISAVESNGGKIVMSKFTIPTVGTGVYFHDTEGNHAGAMQYEPDAMS
jgi:uncharacterized protein